MSHSNALSALTREPSPTKSHIPPETATPATTEPSSRSTRRRRTEEEDVPPVDDAGGADDDRSSPLLASGLGLLGIAGAATGTVIVAAGGSGDSKPPGGETPPTEQRPKADDIKPDPPKPEQPKPEPTTPEAPKSEQSKPEAPKLEQPKLEEPRPEAPKPQPTDPGTTKPEKPKAEDPKPEEPKPDTDAPDAPILTLAADTGASDGDRVTSRATVRVGGLEGGARWIYSIDGGSTWQDGTGHEIPAERFGADGRKEALVRQIDAAGNYGPTAQLRFDLDTQAPDHALLATTSGSALLGRDDALLVTGLEAGAAHSYSIDGGTTWHQADKPKLSALSLGGEGERVVLVRQTDLAGNVGPELSRTLTLDLTPPKSLWVRLPDDPLVSVDALQAGDGVAFTKPGTIYVGVVDQGAHAEYSWNGVDWKPAASLEAIPTSAQPGDGRHGLFMRVTDAAGNETRSVREFTIDGVAPVAPRLALVHDTGISGTDRITGDGSLRILGLEPGARWELTSNRHGNIALIGTGDVIPQSLYDFTSRKDVVALLRQIDEAGNYSPQTRFEFTLDPVAAAGGAVFQL